MNRSWFACIVVTAWLACASAEANSLLNPSFENGWLSPDYWTAWGDGDFVWQSGGARTGTRCMNLGGAEFALMYQRAAGTAGVRYRHSVWARYDSGEGAGAIKLEFHDAGQVKIVEHKRFIYPTAGWTEFSIAGEAPVGTAYVTATIVGLGGSTVLFDDAVLVVPTEDPDLVIDVQAKLHAFGGFGAQAWDASADTIRAYNELNIRYARVASTMAAVVAAAMDINVMFIRWSAPAEWVDGDNELLTEYVDDYAVLWADTVAGLAAGGLVPPYIELVNEPDGDWNTYVSPANYNTLVKLTRMELDARGLGAVGIVGPSLSNLDWDNHNSTWIGALDSQAVGSLAAWGSHAWDDGGVCSGGANCVNSVWPEFGDSADAQDAELPKFISEFATKENVFHGVTYPHPDSSSDYSATNSMPYAARVFENALALINNGAHVPFVWQLTDQDWETKGWGLIDLAGNPKPVYYALRTLWPSVPAGASVIDLGDQSGAVVYTGAFVDDDRLVIGLVNDGADQCDKTLRIVGAAGVQIAEAPACIIDHQGDPALEDPDTAQVVYRNLTVEVDNSIQVTLPADSTLTIVCDLEFEAADLNHDGEVNLDDHAVFVQCLGGPEVNTPPDGCALGQFDGADLDEDDDVDLHDYARFSELLGE